MFYNVTDSGSDHTDADADQPGGSYQGNIIGCAVATWAVAAVFVGLRFYLRGHLMKVLGREDWTILVSLCFSAGISASFIIEAHFGLGTHTATISVSMLRRLLEASWFATLWFAVTIYLTKMSILFLYMRTLTHHWVQQTLRVLVAMVILTCATGIGLVVTACIPLTAYWDASVRATYCHSTDAYYAILGIQLATDLLIFLLPLPVIWSMRAPRDQKLMLLTLFSFGFFICIISIVRLTELTSLRRSVDWTYDSLAIDFWSMVEANTGIVCACVMTMKPLLSRLVPGSTRKGESTQDPLGPGGPGGNNNNNNNHSGNPPTIGSKPSRANTVVKKQSWFTAQLARLDRSLQTVNEADGAASSPRALEAGAGIGTPRGSCRNNNNTTPPLPRPPTFPAVALFLGVPSIGRNSHHSSLSAPIEHEADEGPLGPASYGRRPSGAGSFGGSATSGNNNNNHSNNYARRPSVAESFAASLAAGSFARRPSGAGSFVGSYARRPSCAG